MEFDAYDNGRRLIWPTLVHTEVKMSNNLGHFRVVICGKLPVIYHGKVTGMLPVNTSDIPATSGHRIFARTSH